jgi:U3 small nucleolar RNA-associated protein 7
MFAVAQKKYVHIYDSVGIELHCLTKHLEVNKLAFLPFHWLLASIGSLTFSYTQSQGNAGYLRYQDTSTGKAVAEIRTGLGRCDVMQQNPHNAIIHLGHSNGHVTLYTPNMQKPVVKMWCHRGPVKGNTNLFLSGYIQDLLSTKPAITWLLQASMDK